MFKSIADETKAPAAALIAAAVGAGDAQTARTLTGAAGPPLLCPPHGLGPPGVQASGSRINMAAGAAGEEARLKSHDPIKAKTRQLLCVRAF